MAWWNTNSFSSVDSVTCNQTDAAWRHTTVKIEPELWGFWGVPYDDNSHRVCDTALLLGHSGCGTFFLAAYVCLMGLQRATVKLTGRLQKLHLVFLWNPKNGRAEGRIENSGRRNGSGPFKTVWVCCFRCQCCLQPQSSWGLLSPCPKKVVNTSFYTGMKFFSKNNFILHLSWGTVFTARGIIGL